MNVVQFGTFEEFADELSPNAHIVRVETLRESKPAEGTVGSALTWHKFYVIARAITSHAVMCYTVKTYAQACLTGESLDEAVAATAHMANNVTEALQERGLTVAPGIIDVGDVKPFLAEPPRCDKKG